MASRLRTYIFVTTATLLFRPRLTLATPAIVELKTTGLQRLEQITVVVAGICLVGIFTCAFRIWRMRRKSAPESNLTLATRRWILAFCIVSLLSIITWLVSAYFDHKNAIQTY